MKSLILTISALVLAVGIVFLAASPNKNVKSNVTDTSINAISLDSEEGSASAVNEDDNDEYGGRPHFFKKHHHRKKK